MTIWVIITAFVWGLSTAWRWERTRELRRFDIKRPPSGPRRQP